MSPYNFNFIKRIFKVRKLFSKKPESTDFSSFFPCEPLTRKQRLIEECERLDVSIYIDDPLEQSAGIYAIFRHCASEAELDHRLNAKKRTAIYVQKNVIALFGLIVSIIVKFFL